MASQHPLVVAVLYPDLFPDGALAGLPVDSRIARYVEGSELRVAKSTGVGPSELRDRAPAVTDELRRALADAEIVVSLDVPIDILGLAPRLRWLQSISSGLDHVPVAELRRAGVRVTSSASTSSVPIAEFVVGRLLQVWKNLRAIEQTQQDRGWRFTPGRLVAGRTIGVVGLGSIGSEVAKRMKAFDCRVLATRRRPVEPGAPLPPNVDWLAGADGLGFLLAEADAVVLCAPANDNTRDLIGPAALAAMKQGAVLVNVARGQLVDEAALAAALDGGHLGAAVLDTTRLEPLPADDPLRDSPNLYLSSHTSVSLDGYSAAVQSLFGANLTAYLAGEPMVNEVA